MTRMIPILAVVLVLQIALAFGLHYAEQAKVNDPGKKIVTTDLAPVDKIVLQEKNRKLVIDRVGKVWTLPQVYNFPAAPESVTRLLDQLKNLNGNWPVATTADAAPRFKVASTDFEKRIELSGAGKNMVSVLLGSAAGHDRLHVRVDKTNEIYSVEIPEREVSTESSDWIDRASVELQSADIDSVELPQLKLVRKKKDFELHYGGKVAALDGTAAAEILESIASVNISEVLGAQPKPEYGLDTPILTFSVELKNGVKLKYLFGKLSGSNFYVLRKPSGDFYLKIDPWFVDRLRQLSAEGLVQKSTQLQKLRDSATKQLIEKTQTPNSKVPVGK